MASTAVLMLAVDVWAAAESVEPPRSWWPWLAGFIPGAVVVAALFLGLRRLRRRRSGPDAAVASLECRSANRRGGDATRRPRVDVSIVVPAFDEAERLPRLVQALTESVDRAGVELIVVDDGSTDATDAVARSLLDGHGWDGRVATLSPSTGARAQRCVPASVSHAAARSS